VDEFDHRTYEYYLKKINTEKYFQEFYYNYDDYIKDGENTISIEVDGIMCKFTNPHDDKYIEKEKTKSPISNNLTSILSTNNLTNTPKGGLIDSSMISMNNKNKEKGNDTSRIGDASNISGLSHRKLIY
jgi:hypothetical protein